jgi:hypothetical protein
MEKSGGCLCGQVRYRAASHLATVVCHCRDCQKQSGSAFSLNLIALADQVTVEGELTTFVTGGDSGGEVHRQFCRACGSPVFTRMPQAPQIIIVKAGTLDEPSGLGVTGQQYCERQQDWLKLEAGARFPLAADMSRLLG